VPSEVKIEKSMRGIFIVVDGVRIARRGQPNTLEAGTWVELVPGWRVTDLGDHLAIHYGEVTLH
jgi:hypothetical protein